MFCGCQPGVAFYRLRWTRGGDRFLFMARPVFFSWSRHLREIISCALISAGSFAYGVDLTVNVTEVETGTPISAAVVSVTTLGTEKSVSLEGKSDSSGNWHLSIETNGAVFRLEVKKSGWCPLRLEIPAQSTALSGPISFAMKRAGTVGGTIQDETGKPVAGAQISINFPQKLTGAHIPLDELYATSDAQGKWESDFVPTGTELLRITVTHPAYSWDGSQPSREELTGKSAVSRVQSVLALTGRVVGPDGHPVAGASVMRGDQYGIRGRQSGNETTTDSDGEFRFPPQTAGTIQVAAFAPGFGPVIKEAEVGRGAASVELRLTEPHPLRLRVTDLDGREITDATILVAQWGVLRYPPWEFHDDGGGRFSFGNAPSDKMEVDITAPGRMSLILYSVTPGETENIVELGPSLRLHGNVVDAATKRPVEKFTVTAGWPREVFRNFVMTNQGAEFGMGRRGRDFNGGTYDWMFTQPMVVGSQKPYDFILKVEADGYTPALSRVFGATEKDAAFDFELKAASFLQAVVLLPDGSPASGAVVQALTSADNLNVRRPGMNNSPALSTDAGGRFQLPQPAESEVVLVTNAVGFGAVTFEQLRESPRIKLRPWGRIEGNLKIGTDAGANREVAVGFPNLGGIAFKEPNPEKQLLIRVLQNTVFVSRQAPTDGAGHFIFEGLPPGQVSLMRVESIPTPQSGFSVFSDSVWGGCRMALLDLKEGDKLNVNIGGNGRWVTGRVLSTNRMEDCQTTLYPNAQSRPVLRMREAWPVKLAPDGTFRIPDVRPGNYEISVDSPVPETLERRGPRFFNETSSGPHKSFTVPEGDNLPALPPLDVGEIGEAKPQTKLFAPEPTRAEPVKAAMQASAASVSPGGQFEVLVQARILSDYHIYGMDPKVSPFIPTTLKLTLPDGLEAAGEWTGPSPERDKAGVEIYTGTAVFRRAVKASAGGVPKKCSIGVELEYQVCNNDMCYPPKKVELDATVEVAAAKKP
jgi:hypothetical protein